MAQAAIPFPASTVVITRPDPNGNLEVYLNRRPDQMETYAGVYVFPGGRVEQSDYSTDMIGLTRGITPVEAKQKLGAELEPDMCLAHWIAAVRELFEEAGIHFFISSSGRSADTPAFDNLAERLAVKRPALRRGEITLAHLLLSESLYFDAAQLRYFFHRVTPEHYAVRFDTRFYLAALPPNQKPVHAPEEVSESLWVLPQTALEEAEAGKFRMMPPTLAVLRTLSSYRSWGELYDLLNSP